MPHVHFMISEGEYDTKTTLPAFAKAELEPRGIVCTFSIAPPEHPDDFPNMEALKTADVLFVSVRRQAPTTEQMALIRAHVAAGKAVVGIRTASHAFAPTQVKSSKSAPAGHEYWPEWDHEVLGGNYQNHYGTGIETFAKVDPKAAGHPVLAGIDPQEFQVKSHLYKNPGLPATDTVLMTGRMKDRPEVEPVAWVNQVQGRRVFYTSLGSPGDFTLPQFRLLLRNGIMWTLDRPPAAQAFTVPPTLRFETVLAEPEITQPVFLNFDERGRMWVVEYRQYPVPAGLTMLSHDSYWRAVYDKVPPPPPHQFRGLDRITIHESTKGDGVFDKHQVFLDGLNICTAVERGRGGVWVLNPPYLLFYPDKNDKDVPDGDPVVCLAGFGIQDTHSVANSLRWGPDGWLYGGHGSTVVSDIIRPGIDKQPLVRMTGQGIWRYQPETHRFEVFAEGGGNTFGVEIDAQGRIFSGHNGPNTRGFHYMQGAYLRKGFDKHGPLSNPYAFGFFEAMAHGKVERYSHNFIIYDGGALPADFNGKLLGCEPMQGRIVESEMTPQGASFRTRDLSRPVIGTDGRFRPVDIKLGPDGAVYVADWCDLQINHYRNHEGQIERDNGRIDRLEATDAPPAPRFDLGQLDSDALIATLSNPNKWYRQTALRILGDRHDMAMVPLLAGKLADANGQIALELLWALHLSGGIDEPAALKCLAHREPQVRLWTARLLCDDSEKVTPAEIAALAELAARDSNLEVRAQLACSARRLAAEPCLAIIKGLLSHDEDAADARQPLLLWWAIESKAESDFDKILKLLQEPAIWERPLFRDHLAARTMRRYAQAGSQQDLLRCASLLAAAPTREAAQKLMSGFDEALKGRPAPHLPEALVQAMARQEVGSAAMDLRQGKPAAIDQALATLADEKAPLPRRLELAAIFAEIKAPGCVPVLLELLARTADHALRKAALNTLAAYDGAPIAARILELYPKLDAAARESAQLLLTSRAGWCAQFVAAVEAGSIPPAGVPRSMVHRIRQFQENDLATRALKLWGEEGHPTTAEMNAQIARLTAILGHGNSDVRKGRDSFRALCAGCHTLHGEGGHVGPELTGYNRGDLASLLLNIVNPSAEIREGYENVLASTKDGRTLNGFLAEQDARTVVIRGLDGQNIVIARDDLAEMKTSATSLMPEGLLTTLTDEQVRDLFAYLQSAQPLPAK